MARISRRSRRSKISVASRVVPVNNTVKLPDLLRARIAKAMELEGFTVWSEFCRVALTEKCARVEQALRAQNPAEHARTYLSRS